jgi:non-specific protein-tyrosine kinase
VPKEGKTITAANLAVAVARRGSNAILADFDFRKPGVGETFGLPEDAPGAIQVMSREVPLESALWSASLEGTRPVLESGGSTPAHPPRTGGIRAPQSNGSLRVLPAGGATRSAPHQEQLQYLLTMLQSEADLVILDTPPALLTVEVAELSRLVDAVLLIVRQGVVTQRNLRALQRQLRTWPSDILGTVMTDVRTDTKYADYGKAY